VAIGNLSQSSGVCPPGSTPFPQHIHNQHDSTDGEPYPPHPLDRQVIKDRRPENDSVIGKLQFSKGGVVFDECEESYPSGYRREIAYELRSLLQDQDSKTRDRLEKRIREFNRCGQMVLVRTCSCGCERDGSGSFAGTHRTCKLTVCPTCGWVRAKKVSEFYLQAGKEITAAGPPGHEWQFFTVTTQYRPDLESEVTWQALRSRARLATKVGSKLWQKKLKVDGAAMFRTIECSVRGHVHAHLLYYGPHVESEDLTNLAQKLCGDGVGYIHSRPVEGGDGMGNQLPMEVSKAARYMAKGTSGYGAEFNEGHYGYEGDETPKMHPRLAARWELATQRMHMSQKYGAFRGLDYRRSDYSYEPPDDAEVGCEECGVIGEWHDEYRRAEVWMQDCHIREKVAMIGGRWTPWWKRHKSPPEGWS
jgi:hypothetical protein